MGAPSAHYANRILAQPSSNGVLNTPVDVLLLNFHSPFKRTYSSSSIPARHMALFPSPTLQGMNKYHLARAELPLTSI